MKSFALNTTLLLCSLGWLGLSLAHTVAVQPGEAATLLCPNSSSSPSQSIWFRFANRSQPHCISSTFRADEPATLCTGAESHKFEVTSNGSFIFLKIKDAGLSDAGLYFCGYYFNKHPIILSSTYVKVREEPGQTTTLTALILSGVTLFLTKIITFLVIRMRCQTELDL